MSEEQQQQPDPASTQPPAEGSTTSERVDRDGPVGVPSEDVLAQEAKDLAAMNEARSTVGPATAGGAAATTSSETPPA